MPPKSDSAKMLFSQSQNPSWKVAERGGRRGGQSLGGREPPGRQLLEKGRRLVPCRNPRQIPPDLPCQTEWSEQVSNIPNKGTVISPGPVQHRAHDQLDVPTVLVRRGFCCSCMKSSSFPREKDKGRIVQISQNSMNSAAATWTFEAASQSETWFAPCHEQYGDSPLSQYPSRINPIRVSMISELRPD